MSALGLALVVNVVLWVAAASGLVSLAIAAVVIFDGVREEIRRRGRPVHDGPSDYHRTGEGAGDKEREERRGRRVP
jgi:hypothetical protein